MLKQLFFLFLIAFATCEIAKQEVQVIEDVIEENEYNWNALIACLREVTPVSGSVKRLIFLVRKKRFEEAEAVLQKMIETIEALHNSSSCIREHRRLVVVTVCMKTVNLEIFP